ncbi:lytic transglycosylase domain-containing protein [Pantoea agglomerans]|uniref:lytic transglycosylase domain-containing protein n=1 Tax=Enterobacter agglomerans TaxID=549 RepID=UPI0024139FD5|nr:lytic transglycosylase domain-containing protein [Pantoea agglomerans]
MISTAAFLALAMKCAPDVAPDTLSRIVKTESGFNPWAIGVVGTPLNRQPQTKEEALNAIKLLVNNKANFSIGLAQVNRQYFDVKDVESVFSPCTNLKMGSDILKDCYSRALGKSDSEQQALKKSFSCYYSGNYTRGFKKESNGTSYVERVVAANTTTIKVPSLDVDSEREKPSQKDTPVYDAWDVLQQYPKYIKSGQSDNISPDGKVDDEKTNVKS